MMYLTCIDMYTEQTDDAYPGSTGRHAAEQQRRTRGGAQVLWSLEIRNCVHFLRRFHPQIYSHKVTTSVHAGQKKFQKQSTASGHIEAHSCSQLYATVNGHQEVKVCYFFPSLTQGMLRAKPFYAHTCGLQC